MQRQQPYSQRNHSYFPIALTDENQLLQCRAALKNKGINPRRYFYPSLDTLSYVQPQIPQTESRALSRRVLCLPIYPGLPRHVQNTVIETLLSPSSQGSHLATERIWPQVAASLLLEDRLSPPAPAYKRIY